MSDPPLTDDERLTVESLRHLRELLFDADARKAEAEVFLDRASAVLASVVEEAEATGAVVVGGGSADLVTPKGELSVEKRQSLWERAVREAGLEEAAKRAEEPTPEAPEPATLSPDERFREAHVAFGRGARAEARSLLESLLAAHSQHSRALGLLGRVSYLDGKDDEARRWSEAALAVDPEDFEPWATLGLVSGRAKDFAQQVRYDSRAFECAPRALMLGDDPLTVEHLQGQRFALGDVLHRRVADGVTLVELPAHALEARRAVPRALGVVALVERALRRRRPGVARLVRGVAPAGRDERHDA